MSVDFIMHALLGLLPPHTSPHYFPLLLGMTACSVFFGAANSILGGSIVADCVDDQELVSGRRQEGGFFGVYAFAGKALAGLGIWIGGVVLDLIGFPSNAAPGTVEQSTLDRSGTGPRR